MSRTNQSSNSPATTVGVATTIGTLSIAPPAVKQQILVKLLTLMHSHQW